MSDSTRSRGRDAWPPFTGQRPELSCTPQTHGNVSPSGSAPHATRHQYQDANLASRMQPGAIPPPPCFNGGYINPLPPSSTPATPGQSVVPRPARRESLGANTIYATAPPAVPLEGTGRFVPPAADIKAGQEEAAARLAWQQGFAARPPPPYAARPPPQELAARPPLQELAARPPPPSVWPLPGPVHQFHSWLFVSQLNALDMYSAAEIDREALARALLTVPVPASY